MVAPIVQRPIITSYELDPIASFGWKSKYEWKTHYVQKAPYNLVAPYERRSGTGQAGGVLAGANAPVGAPRHDASTIYNAYYDDSYMTRASNQAYEKLRNRIYDTAGLGVDFVEYRQALSMIGQTCGTLWRAARAVRRLDLVAAAQILKMKIVPPGASRRKSFANLWLEYHFGWEPLVHDIYDACTVINNPLKIFTKTRAVGRDDKAVYVYFQDLGSVTDSGWWRTTYKVAQGGSFRVTNWNQHLLEQMGLTNPLSLAWEVVPFSFVVDWFVNVGDFLRSQTDYAGMTFDTSFTSKLYQVDEWGICKAKPGYTGSPRIFRCYGAWMRRSAGLTGPSLNVKKVSLPSVARALTAVSLLTQVLTKR